MKLRQKLAAVLAATLIATSVPVVTMAASDNTLTHGVTVKEKDTPITAGGLKVTMKDNVDTTGAMFFVNLENAEWTSTTTTTASSNGVDIEYKATGKKELQVTVKASGADAKTEFILPLAVKLTGGDATVAIDGNGSVISDMAAVVFAKTSDAKAAVTVADAKAINKSGIIADITIEEALLGSMGTEEVTVSLDNTDYEFVGVDVANIELSRGFVGKTATITGAPVTSDEFKFTLDSASTAATGRIVLKNVTIKAKSGKTSVIGEEINVTVSGSKVVDTTVKVAKIQQFGTTLTMKDEKVVDVVAGKKQKVTFTIKENVNDSIIANRNIEVRFDKAFLANVKKADLTTFSAADLVAKAKIGSNTGAAAVHNLTLATDKDDKVIGFDFQVVPAALGGTGAHEITFTDVELFVPVNVTGSVKLLVEGRALEDDLEVVALNVKAPVEITSEAFTLKVGLKDQKGGKLVITETDKGMLKTGQNLEIAIDGKDKGFEFTGKPVVTVEGDMLLDLDNMAVSATGDKITIPVKRASRTASTITISDMKMTVDRTVPEGKYNVKVSGGALALDCTFETLTVKDFIVVGTPNTQDLAANGLRKGVATFAIGDKNFTMNGVTAEMDGAPYISNGRTMVPVRYVANALGVSAQDIYFANGTVTIIAGNKTISLTIGDKVAKLNGVPARVMETAPVIKDGRTYVPVSEIGALLGVNASWDNATKVATFENK